MSHHTAIEYTPDGHLAICETCGSRADRFMGFGEADQWCREHEHKAEYNRLNVGARPGLKSLERQFREKSTLTVYTPEEREMWRLLAEEIAVELAARAPGPIEGQMALFGETEGETA